MNLQERVSQAELLLGPQELMGLLVELAEAVLPALDEVPRSQKVASDALTYVHEKSAKGAPVAQDLYAFANQPDGTGLAFEEGNVTQLHEVSAVVTVTCAYYFSIWYWASLEGWPLPEDVESVPELKLLNIVNYAVQSLAVAESDVLNLLDRHLSKKLS